MSFFRGARRLGAANLSQRPFRTARGGHFGRDPGLAAARHDESPGGEGACARRGIHGILIAPGGME